MPADGTLLVDRIDQSVNAMDALFTAILDISRLDAGVVPVHRRPFAIGAVLERVCREVAADAHGKGLSLSYVRSNAVVDSDPVLIERIARNLLSNAVRYTDTGRIVVGCRRTRQHVRLQFIDTGHGIPADQQARVFDDYYQLRRRGDGFRTGRRPRAGDRAAPCGAARLSADAALRTRAGPCFELQLVRLDTAVQPGAAADEIAVDETTAAAHLVVVIDDESAIRAGMSMLLERWGYKVVTAASVDDAIACLASCEVRPTLLICDLHLHGDQNGIAAIARIRDEYNTAIPAMLITGDTTARRPGRLKHGGFVLLHAGAERQAARGDGVPAACAGPGQQRQADAG